VKFDDATTHHTTTRKRHMATAVGDKVPDVEVRTLGDDGVPQAVRTGDVLGTGKVVLFAVPGAFTPGCSKVHLPGFVQRADEVLAKGVDRIACIAVNDAWVMDAWAKSQGANDKILMLADGNGEFTKAMGLEFDGGGVGLGLRSQRYSAVIENGVVTQLDVEPKPGVDVSSCESVLTRL
jgi:glutaredoxin/glutathione-dependent peroxiredoxin